jgi:hypothetical protein
MWSWLYMEQLVALKRLNAVLALLPPADPPADEAARRRLAETLICLVRNAIGNAQTKREPVNVSPPYAHSTRAHSGSLRRKPWIAL